MLLSCCKQEKKSTSVINKNIVICFDHYNPQRYKTPGIGMMHIPMPKVLYTDSTGTLVDYSPKYDFDTIVLYSSHKYKEIALSYRDFEFAYYMPVQGDTITISMDSLNYPILKSKHNTAYDKVYNMNYELRKGRTHCGLEAKTCLGNSFATIAQDIDFILSQEWGARYKTDYCPLDSLHTMFENYKRAYTDTINSYKKRSLISEDMYEHYKFLLQLKEFESKRILNKDPSYYQQMESGISDRYCTNPSYYEYLDYYLWFFNLHIQNIKESQMEYIDWRQTFDQLSQKNFQPNSMRILLKQCIKEIGDKFSANDVNKYLAKYIGITGDSVLYNNIVEQYNLTVDSNQLLLKDIHGNLINFQQLLDNHKGKVIYIDFWASWCLPCREEMEDANRLRNKYKGKDVTFIYLAYKDKESSWAKAVQEENLSTIETNYIILNFKNSKILENIKLKSVPRYLIIDRNGSLVEMNAPRPSDKNIETYLNKYLHNGCASQNH